MSWAEANQVTNVDAGIAAVTVIWDCGLVTDSRDSLVKSLIAVALAVQEALPGRISGPSLQPPTEDLDWPAGVALQHILEAGVNAEDVLALVRQARVRAIADAIAVIDQSADWAICDLANGAHEQLGGLDSEFWFLVNLPHQTQLTVVGQTLTTKVRLGASLRRVPL